MQRRSFLKSLVALAVSTTLPDQLTSTVEPSFSIETAKLAYAKFLNVLDFGAIGDGISDDSDAFRRAIDKAKNYSEEKVYITVHKGTYYFNNTVPLPGKLSEKISIG
jgi:polygalacturonase